MAWGLKSHNIIKYDKIQLLFFEKLWNKNDNKLCVFRVIVLYLWIFVLLYSSVDLVTGPSLLSL